MTGYYLYHTTRGEKSQGGKEGEGINFLAELFGGVGTLGDGGRSCTMNVPFRRKRKGLIGFGSCGRSVRPLFIRSHPPPEAGPLHRPVRPLFIRSHPPPEAGPHRPPCRTVVRQRHRCCVGSRGRGGQVPPRLGYHGAAHLPRGGFGAESFGHGDDRTGLGYLRENRRFSLRGPSLVRFLRPSKK